VFVPKSKRLANTATAKSISSELGPFVTRVGLFLDQAPAEIEEVLTAIPGLVLQFHGTETPAECERYGVPYIKAIGLGGGMPSKSALSEYENAMAFLFDSNEPGQLGGTGHAFDWQKLDDTSGKPMVLAGGLYPANVGEAIKQIQPHAVDVSTGVEQSHGIKNPDALKAFVDAVHLADAQVNRS